MTAAQIRELVVGCGACAAGVCRVAAVSDIEKNRLSRWLVAARHGSMDYLERNAHLAGDPRSLLPGAQTIICAAFCYTPAGGSDRSPLFADYARGADYHKVLKKRLRPVARHLEAAEPGSATRMCVDSAPVRERYWAVAAGLGFIGLNGQLIVPGVGSKVFLAEILWTGRVEDATAVKADFAPSPACIQCGACVKACPGGALDGLGGVDARRCLSYLTIEHRGALSPSLKLPERIYGCDICQDVCPEQHQALPLTEFTLRPGLAALGIEDLANLTDQTYAETFAGSAIRRAPLRQLLRNIAHK